MVKKGYALCDGMVYKKPPEAKFTYVLCTTVKKFLMKCLKKHKIAELLTTCIEKVNELLSDPACGLIRPITRLFNAVEVLPPGTLFLIAEKRFVRMKSLDKHHSPRAFVKYVYKSDRVPYPLPFVQGLFMNIFCKNHIKFVLPSLGLENLIMNKALLIKFMD